MNDFIKEMLFPSHAGTKYSAQCASIKVIRATYLFMPPLYTGGVCTCKAFRTSHQKLTELDPFDGIIQYAGTCTDLGRDD